MKYYKLTNETFGGFYDSEIHTDIELTEDNRYYLLTDDEWNTLLEGNGEIQYKDGILQNYTNTRAENVTNGTVTLETEKAKARIQRTSDFTALDLYDKAVLRGDIEETDDEKIERDTFRTAWLSITDDYTDINTDISELYPTMPTVIEYFN